jgi:hypothetical protein
MSDALDTLQTNYFYLTDNLDDLLDRCQTDDQRAALMASYRQAKLSFYTARNLAFAAGDTDIAQAVSDMKSAQTSLETMIKELAQITAVVTAVATAVRIGTELASMAK